jgi:hypothetical protein
MVGTTNKSMATMSARGYAETCAIPDLGAHTAGPCTWQRSTGDFKSKLEQFAVYAWRTPQRVLDADPPDQGAQLHADLRTPASRA